MKVSAARKQAFVEALVHGQTPETAAKAIGIDRVTAYRWRKADAAFAAAWQDATDRKVEVIENTLYRMAVEKDLGAVIFFLKCHKPEVYNRRQVIAVGGDPDNPFSVTHHGSDETVHILMPANFRDQAEQVTDETITIEGTAAEEDAA